MDTRRRLNRIAVSQHGLITLDQATAAGLTLGQIRRRARSGEWVVSRPRVYGVAGVAPTWEQAVAATILSLGPRAWASHATAARLWRLIAEEPEAIDVLVPLDRRVKMAGVRSHRTTGLFTADLTACRRIAVTGPERTIVDLSGSLSATTLGSLLDDALRRRVITLERLRRCVGRLDGSPNRRPAVIHELLAARLPGFEPGDSDLETRILRVIVSAGLPVPVQQHRVRIAGRQVRIDLAYPDVKLAIELDGWEFHGTRTAFDDDRARANLLVAHGWTLLRFTSRSPNEEILRCVEAALGQCGRFGAA